MERCLRKVQEEQSIPRARGLDWIFKFESGVLRLNLSRSKRFVCGQTYLHEMESSEYGLPSSMGVAN